MLALFCFVFGVCVSTCFFYCLGVGLGVYFGAVWPINRTSVEGFGEAGLGSILAWFLEVSWILLKFIVRENWMAMTRWRGLR